MSTKRVGGHAFFAACAGLALIGAAACGPNNNESITAVPPNAETPMASDAASNGSGNPITVTGCLQQQGGDYILTAMNEPSTAGAPAGVENKVDREQVAAARHAYKLNSDDELDVLIGKSVRVEGTLAEASDVVPAGNDRSDKSNVEIDDDDLAEIDVRTVNQVADACGGGDAR